MYRRLQAEQILVTAKTLHHRVSERFSGWGISQVAEELHTLAQEVKTSLAWIAKPILILRLSIGALITVVILLVINGLVHLDISNQAFTPTDILTLIEAAIQDAVFFGAGIYFLVSLENRIKRGRALNRLNQLRALAHVIDMHQLTKDPERVL
ncbi:MAG: hypothetical protein OEZ02_13220, partial [Anaerolineae bacterium]|nr:hypothetical protein [Anaerolineae bacterium]